MFIQDLKSRLAVRPQISTDAFPAYYGSIRRAFSSQVDYAQTVKVFASDGQPDRELISASYVERQNLTMRMCQRFKRKRRKMTKQEAINVLAEFRKTLMALDPTTGRRAFDALINDTRVMTTAAQRAADARNALQTPRRAFQEIDGKGIQFPSN